MEMHASVGTPDSIVKLGYSFRAAKALLSAVELGVFTALADGPRDLDALRDRIGIDGRSARDFFDALVALRLLGRDENGRYSNTAEADLYLDSRKPSFIGALFDHLNAHEYRNWDLLTSALVTGKPQSGSGAAVNFDAYYSDPATRDQFVRRMTGGSLHAAKVIAESFPWRNHKTLLDIGTAQGCLPVQVALANPHIAGGGFDLPALAPVFDSYVREHGLSSRLRFFAGDFLKDELPAADVLVMGRVLHNWDLPNKRMLLKKAYDALPSGGALIVYESLIDDDRRANAAGLLSSLNMLIVTAGGFDYTGADCIGWMRDAGFHHVHIEPLTAEQSMVIGTR